MYLAKSERGFFVSHLSTYLSVMQNRYLLVGSGFQIRFKKLNPVTIYILALKNYVLWERIS